MDFPIRTVLKKCAQAVSDRPPAAMFGLREEGFGSLYEQLVSCILSIRTYDEVSLVASRELFSRARTPEEMVELDREELLNLIFKVTYPGQKADNILRLSQEIIDLHGGEIPDDFDKLTTFRGVGTKCANLALGVALDRPAISVDVHVHRITNRWGYVHTSSPTNTFKQLEEKLPKDLWIEINRVLVPFGKHVCTGRSPHCATCPVSDECAQLIK